MSNFKTIRVGKNVAYLHGGKTGKYFALYYKGTKIKFDDTTTNYTINEIYHLLSLEFELKLEGWPRVNRLRPIRNYFYEAIIKFDNGTVIKTRHTTEDLAKKQCYKYAKSGCDTRCVINSETGEVLWSK